MKRNLMMNMTMTALMIVSLAGTGAISGVTGYQTDVDTIGTTLAISTTATADTQQTSDDDEKQTAAQ